MLKALAYVKRLSRLRICTEREGQLEKERRDREKEREEREKGEEGREGFLAVCGGCQARKGREAATVRGHRASVKLNKKYTAN